MWTVYILRCADNSLYTGITNDMTKRLAQHQNGTGAKYTRGRSPLIIVYQEQQPSRAEALRREASIKKLSRKQKETLVRKTAAKPRKTLRRPA